MPNASPNYLRFCSPINFIGPNSWALTIMSALLICGVTQSTNPGLTYMLQALASFFMVIVGLRVAIKEVFELDRIRNSYRKTHSFLGITAGNWQKLPPIKAVVIKSFSQYETSKTYSQDAVKEYLIVMLSTENSRVGIVVQKFDTSNEDDAQTIATQLAYSLSIPQAEFRQP